MAPPWQSPSSAVCPETSDDGWRSQMSSPMASSWTAAAALAAQIWCSPSLAVSSRRAWRQTKSSSTPSSRAFATQSGRMRLWTCCFTGCLSWAALLMWWRITPLSMASLRKAM
ncbi:hypothetical protein VPH35_005982 [Triticum aestivum]